MLNVAAIERGEMSQDPFVHVCIDRLLRQAVVQDLLNNLPSKGHVLSERRVGSDKTYQVINNVLQPLGHKLDARGLHASWRALLTDLNGLTYRQSLSARLGLDLTGLHLEITLKQYRPGHYISPHTDRRCVPATHLLFLNSKWQHDWGGLLCLLDANLNEAVRVRPSGGNSLAFRQSDVSWHKVTPVAAHAPTRIALQIAFWQALVREDLDGRVCHALAERAS